MSIASALLREVLDDPDLLGELADALGPRLAGRQAEPSAWLDTRGAAAHLSCSVDRVHDLVGLGRLRPRRDGRRLLFRRDELDAYVEGSA